MAYSLDEFCDDCRVALKADPSPGGREAVRQNLERLLAEPSFLDRHVLSAPPGRAEMVDRMSLPGHDSRLSNGLTSRSLITSPQTRMRRDPAPRAGLRGGTRLGPFGPRP